MKETDQYETEEMKQTNTVVEISARFILHISWESCGQKPWIRHFSSASKPH